MKIFPVNTIAEIDEYTIEHEPILSINLMERAARGIFEILSEDYSDRSFLVLAGPGNNGGDALAISRMLILSEFEVVILLLKSENLSEDATINKERLSHLQQSKIIELEKGDQLPHLSKNFVVVDGLFGSGLNRSLGGGALELVRWVNSQELEVLSIDNPSGLFGEDNGGNNRDGIIRASRTFTFQFPKLAFLFPESHEFVGSWEVLDIGLHPQKIEETTTNLIFTTMEVCRGWLPPRRIFDHKGTMGHVLLIAGSYGKMGAAILSARASLRAGAGLLTVQVPHNTCRAMHVAVPEAMVSIDRSDLMFTEYPPLNQFSAIGIGPGLGVRSNSVKALNLFLDEAADIPCVFDADAINIIATEPEMKDKLPENCVLTPHPKEFERLAGSWKNDYERFRKAREFAMKYKIVLVLKGAYTMVVTPKGHCYFNSTGNPGMATAGCGDTLTGIILALLGRGMPSCQAAITGVYLHGLAGDLAKELQGEESLIASDIISSLGLAFKKMTGVYLATRSASEPLYRSSSEARSRCL